METVNLADITQEEFDDAVQMVISGIKSSDPKLDTRLGTVLRSLLVNPEARIEAVTKHQIENFRKASSLKTLLAASEAGEAVSVDDVNAVMSNFRIKQNTGTYSEGIVKITVSSGDQVYSVAEGVDFETVDGLHYTSVEAITAIAEESGLKISHNSTLYKSTAGYFFLVPVRAVEVGADYNIRQGTSLNVNTAIYTFVSAEAYKSFDGGSDISDLRETIDKIPSSLSIRGFVNKYSCEGMLRDKFDDGNYPIRACSAVGYGNGAQRRDKHNPFGVGIGGRIDLYVRNFGDVFTITKTIIGTKTPDKDGEYDLTITAEDFPGSCWVKFVGDINTDVTSPLEFSCVRTPTGVNSTWHDFNISKNSTEIFNTVWQNLDVHLTEVPPDEEDDTWSASRPFQVTVYCLPQADLIQEFVDSDYVRSISTDVVVRCPILCNVTVTATVIYDSKNPMDEESAKYNIRKYINSLGFVGTLTRSEIVHVLKDCGAVSVDLNKKDMLYGTLHDAYGVEHNLTGDALQFDGIASSEAMLSKDTAIFVAEPENIQLIMIPNS